VKKATLELSAKQLGEHAKEPDAAAERLFSITFGPVTFISAPCVALGMRLYCWIK
jgi:hypothetical protein